MPAGTQWPGSVCNESELGSLDAELLTMLGSPSLSDTEFWNPLRARAASWIGTPKPSRVKAVHDAPSSFPNHLTSSQDCTSADLPNADRKTFPFLMLPRELRDQILGHLVPDVDVISQISDGWALDEYIGRRVGGIFRLRKDHANCHMAILRVNRQLFAEGSSIAYGRIFRLKVTWDAVEFLRYFLSWHLRHDNTLDLFPFYMVRHIHVEIASDRKSISDTLLHNIIYLCRELNRAPELQSLQIDLVNGREWHGRGWSTTSRWRQRASNSLERRRSGGNRPLPRSTDQWYCIDDDIEVALQPFGLLRNVKHCIINLPPFLEAEEGLTAAVGYLQKKMTSKPIAEDSECDKTLVRLWQSDVQQLLSLGVNLGRQSTYVHQITRERTGEASSRITFLRMKLCIKELDARFGVSSA